MRGRGPAQFAAWVALVAATATAMAASGTAAGATVPAAASYELGFLLRSQAADGGFPMQAGQPSSTMVSAWAALAIAAARNAGILPAAAHDGSAVATYLERTVRTDTDPGSIERTVVALRALGRPVADVDGVPLLRRLERLIATDGAVGNQTNLTSWAVIALRSADATIPAVAVRWIVRQQDGDGGFNFGTGGRSTPSDPDDTGAALEALAAAGAISTDRAAVRRALGYLRSDENRDGGFGSPQGSSSNTQSTAWAVQGLIAAGVNPNGFHRRHGHTPSFYLRAMTHASGLVDYSQGVVQSPVWVTGDALPALLGQPYPLAAPDRVLERRPQSTRDAARTRAGRRATTTIDVPRSIGRLIGSLHSLL